MQYNEQEMFNTYCADVMGYYRGQFSAENLYFEEGNRLVMPVSEYDPYNDLTEMQPVVDSLICGLGLHLDSGTTKQYGILIAARSLIFRAMQNNIEHSSDNKEVIKVCVGKERFWEAETKTDTELEFNTFCANTMWINCVEKISPYEDNTGEHIRTVLHIVGDNSVYDPYNNIKQLGIVIKQLYGINNPNSSPFEPEDLAGASEISILASWRNYVIQQMPNSQPDQFNSLFDLSDEQLNACYKKDDLLDIEEGWDEYDRKMEDAVDIFDDSSSKVSNPPTDFNEHCAKIMGWHRGLQDGITNILFDQYGWIASHVDTYDPYNDLSQLQPVVNTLISSHGWCLNSDTVCHWGWLVAARELVTDALPAIDSCAEYAESETSQQPTNEWLETRWNKALDNLENTEKNILKQSFNTKCANLLGLTTGGGSTKGIYFDGAYYCKVATYNPYDNMEQLARVVEKLMFKNTGGNDVNFKFKNRPNAVLEEWRDYINNAVVLTKHEQFNKICRMLVDGYNIHKCHADDEMFDPYNNIEDLAPILPAVATRVGELFTLGEIMYDLPKEERNMDILDNMRHYIQRHGQTLLDIMEEDS